MKKTILAVGFIVVGAIIGCKKEEIKPSEPCNCGRILSDDITDYSVVIRNNCTGNNKKFVLYEGDWMNAHPGDDLCITGANKW